MSRIALGGPLMDPRALPASFLMESAKDPANAWPGAPPNFGEPVVPHIMTVSGRIGTKAYQWADEALRDSRVNADKMETDCGIMECVEARQRSQSLLNWHIQPEDDQSIEQKQLVEEMARIISRTPYMTGMRFAASKCIWYGRNGVALQFKKDYVGGHMRTIVKRWEPRHGDKFVFRWDDGSHEYDPDQIGIRITAGYHEIPNSKFIDTTGQERNLIEATQYGLVRWFTPKERETIILDKHIIEDGPFDDPVRAGAIHGVGIRDRIYWTWYGMIECLADVLSYLERSAFGVEIWTYPAGNEQARIRTENAAKKQTSGGRSVLIVPKERGENSEDFGVQQIEPGLGGIESAMSLVKEYFGHKIKRYILGQTLTSEAAGTGLGSGVADAHMATFADIVKFDAVGREETLTRDFLRPLQLWNFPKSRGIYLRFVIDTESPDADGKMQGYQAAWNMGAGLKEEEVLSIIGASMPKATDRVLRNPALQQQPMQIPGSGIEGAGQQGSGEQGSLEDLFGPLANDSEESEPSGGDEPPANPSEGGGPSQYALTDDVEVDRYTRRRQIRSSPGQQPLPELGDANAKQHHIWREELHPRDAGGQWSEKPGGKKLPSQFGQGILFHELASKLDQSEQAVEPHEKAVQGDLFQALANSEVPPEQLAALLSGDQERMNELRNHAHATGQAEMPSPSVPEPSNEPPAGTPGGSDQQEDGGGFELQRSKVREGAQPTTTPDTGGRQEAFFHGLDDAPGQGQMFEGMDLAGPENSGHNSTMLDPNKKYERHELEKLTPEDLASIKASTTKDRVRRLAEQIERELLRAKQPESPEDAERKKREKEERESREKPLRDAVESGLKIIGSTKLSDDDKHLAGTYLGQCGSPREAKRYVEAVASWKSPYPERAAIEWAVKALKKRGIKLSQKGGNYSWYGKTEDGKTVRVSDHLGHDAHDIDIVYETERPPTKEQAKSQLDDALNS